MFHSVPRLHTAEGSDPVALQPGAVDQPARPEALSGRAQLYPVTGFGETCNLCAGAQLAAFFDDHLREGFGDTDEVYYPRARHLERRDTRGVWFELFELPRSDLLDREAVLYAPLVEVSQTRHLSRLRRDDNLATDLVRDPILPAELHEPLCSLLTEAGLQAPRLVVDAAVNHAAVVAGLVVGPIRLLLEHHYARVRVTVQKRLGSGEPDDTAAYHREVVHRCEPPLSRYVSPSRGLYTVPMFLSGVCTIALTPFTEEGDVDLGGIDSLARLYLDSGVHGLTILGIMGEAHKLSDAERSTVMERYLEAAVDRVPVVVGCSAVATKVTIEWAREAEESGAAAVMVAPPNQVRNLDLVFEHYRRGAGGGSFPGGVEGGAGEKGGGV